jgi:hypothetical protein
MDHPEQPALARVFDVNVGSEQISGGHLCVVRPADARINIIRPAFVVDEIRHRGSRGHVAKGVHLQGLTPNRRDEADESISGLSWDISTPVRNRSGDVRRRW